VGGHPHISLGTFLLAAVLGEFVLNPLSVLAHELGHAMVALKSSQDKVTVVVGRRSAAIGIVSERLAIWWSPIPTRGLIFDGHCIWNVGQASPREWLWAVLAGPSVNVVLIPIYTYLFFLTDDPSSPRVISGVFFIGAASCIINCLINLNPWESRAEKERRSRRGAMDPRRSPPIG
jgi:hypothetical protein